jgi:hypothetical protein
VYHCALCDYWHITTKDKRYAKRLERKLRHLLHDDQASRATADPIQ